MIGLTPSLNSNKMKLDFAWLCEAGNPLYASCGFNFGPLSCSTLLAAIFLFLIWYLCIQLLINMFPNLLVYFIINLLIKYSCIGRGTSFCTSSFSFIGNFH